MSNSRVVYLTHVDAKYKYTMENSLNNKKTASLFFNLKHAYLAYTFSKFIDRIKEELCPNLVDY